jgi:hypothetical protein
MEELHVPPEFPHACEPLDLVVAFRGILRNDWSERQAREQHDPRENPSRPMPSDDA